MWWFIVLFGVIISSVLLVKFKIVDPGYDDWFFPALFFAGVFWIAVGFGAVMIMADKSEKRANYNTYVELKGGQLSFEDWKRLRAYEKKAAPSSGRKTFISPIPSMKIY